MTNQEAPSRVHLVGSIPLQSSEEVFAKISKALPGRLDRIPDGEMGERYYFVGWQQFVFPRKTSRAAEPRDDLGKAHQYSIQDVKPTKYDDHAISSYAVFLKKREEGIIPPGVRFQVCLPTPLNTLFDSLDFKYRAEMEPLYEERLLQSLRRIQDEIPPSDLAIQWDVAIDFAYMEYENGNLTSDFFKPYFSPVKEGVLKRLTRLLAAVDENVELGCHLCYGDRDHEHFYNPTSTDLLVEFANEIVRRSTHAISWIHMPVPKGSDSAYFQALSGLRLQGAQLFLGLVHHHDEEGTRKRIEMGQAVYRHPFGVATECGMGRYSTEDFESAVRISAAVTVTKA